MRVPDNGWELLIAWLTADVVSPELVRIVSATSDSEVIDEITFRDGTTRVVHRWMTDEERDELREMHNEYLTDAGAPELPAGFAVYLTLPSNIATMDELCEVAWAGLRDLEAPHPREIAADLRKILPPLYVSSAQ